MHGMLKTFTSVKIAADMIQRKCLYFYISFGTFQIYWNIWQKMNALIIINWKIKSCSLKKSFALQVEFKAAIFSIDVTRVLWKELNFHFNDQLFGIDIKLLLNYIPFNSSCFLTIEYNKVKNAPIQKIDDTVLADTNSRHYILS